MNAIRNRPPVAPSCGVSTCRGAVGRDAVRWLVFRVMIAMIGVASLFVASTTHADDFATQQQSAVRAATEAVADSVVAIETVGGLEKVDGELASTAPTSGLIVHRDGWIVSNALHFAQQPGSILVTLPHGERKSARIVARDRSRMLVLLKVDTDQSLVAASPVPRDALRVGQTAIAVGRTFDMTRVNLSVGIVSALHRIWDKAVQTDAKVSAANYGGPLIDLQGRVMGVLVPLSPESDQVQDGVEWYDSGIGFAVPLTDILARLESWQQGHDLMPGLLGFSFENTQQLDAPPLIGFVKRNSPAFLAGLRAGDRLIAINERPVTLQSHALQALKPLYAGDRVRITIDRQGTTSDLEAQLVDKLPPYEHAYLGVAPARDVRPEAGGENEQSPGIALRYVFPGSPAAVAGLQTNDRLLKWKDTSLDSIDRLQVLLLNQQPGDEVEITIQHDGKPETRKLTLDLLPCDIPSEEDWPNAAAVPAQPPAQEANAAPAGVAPKEIETGRVDVEISDEAKRCVAWVPPNYDGSRPWALVMVIPAPGTELNEQLWQPWQTMAAERELILLFPKSARDERWSLDDIDYLRKVIQVSKRRWSVDPRRLVVVGQDAGGSMASLLAFRYRDAIRGLVMIQATVPSDAPWPESDPVRRLAVLSEHVAGSPRDARMAADRNTLVERRIPVAEWQRDAVAQELNDRERAELGRWIDALDRL